MKRPDSVRIDARDITGERFALQLTGLPARVFQHEYDHLQVICYWQMFCCARLENSRVICQIFMILLCKLGLQWGGYPLPFWKSGVLCFAFLAVYIRLIALILLIGNSAVFFVKFRWQYLKIGSKIIPIWQSIAEKQLRTPKFKGRANTLGPIMYSIVEGL